MTCERSVDPVTAEVVNTEEEERLVQQKINQALERERQRAVVAEVIPVNDADQFESDTHRFGTRRRRLMYLAVMLVIIGVVIGVYLLLVLLEVVVMVMVMVSHFLRWQSRSLKGSKLVMPSESLLSFQVMVQQWLLAQEMQIMFKCFNGTILNGIKLVKQFTVMALDSLVGVLT